MATYAAPVAGPSMDHEDPVDAFLVGSIVVSFATLLTAHLALAAGLLARSPRSRGLVALLVPPLAPYYGAREKLWVRAILWIASLVVYVAARIAAHFYARG